jgi:hypothetical protein
LRIRLQLWQFERSHRRVRVAEDGNSEATEATESSVLRSGRTALRAVRVAMILKNKHLIVGFGCLFLRIIATRATAAEGRRPPRATPRNSLRGLRGL